MAVSTFDLVVVVLYICGIFVVGIWAFFVNRRQNKNGKEAEKYFLASRNANWIAVGFTLFCSNIGTEHFVGLAGTAANTGIAVGVYELNAPFILFLLAFCISKIYIKSKVTTTPEYLELRFNRIIRVYNACLMLFLFIFTEIAGTVYAGGIILEVILGWNIFLSSIILILITGLYVILGGLRAVIYTENIQAVILIIGGLIVTFTSLHKIGGFKGLRDHYKDLEKNNMSMARPANDPDWPWPCVYITILLQSYYYWTCNQDLVQRVLSSKTQLHATYGAVFAATLKLLPIFMMVVPGMVSSALYGNEYIIDDRPSSYDNAYPYLVVKILPSGLIGIVIASMLSALMSSLASIYNSASTVIMNDIYTIIKPNSSDTTKVIVGRVASVGLMVISLLWLPVIKNGSSEVFNHIQSIYSYIQNPLAVVYFFGHFWKRGNPYGAFAAIFVGTTIGLFRFIFSLILKNKYCYNIFCESHYLYFGLFSFILCSAIFVIVSLLTPAPDDNKINGLVYGYLDVNNKVDTRESSNDEENGDSKHKKQISQVELVKNDAMISDNDAENVDTQNVTNKDGHPHVTDDDNADDNGNCCLKLITLDGNPDKLWKGVKIWAVTTALAIIVLYIYFA